MPFARLKILAITLSYLCLLTGISFGEVREKQGPFQEKFKAGELLVKFKTGVPEATKEQLHRKHGAKSIKKFPTLRLQLVKLKAGESVAEGISRYQGESAVEYAEPNLIVSSQVLPNDPLFGQLYGLAKIKAPAAWDVNIGSPDVVVAVLDSGVQYNHGDLAANMWTNTSELNGLVGVDDDANGYVDDVYGINAITGSGNPLDDCGHGTHVAGTIGAMGNNATGVVGVDWNLKIVACKFLDAAGNGYISDAVECLQYIANLKARGVKVVATNNSWGWVGSPSQALQDAIDAQREILFVAAAGNNAADADATPHFPAAYSLPNVISVAASNAADQKASFSNFGRRSVHVGAPGDAILSTMSAVNKWGIAAPYGTLSGTSMATPHTTGLVALLKAQDESRDWKNLKNLLLAGGDTVASMTSTTVTGRRINAQGSLTCLDSPVFSALKFPKSWTVGVPQTFSALSINCDLPVEPVTATMDGNETITLLDDGVAPDLAADDGIFTGSWVPVTTAVNTFHFTSPAGSETLEQRHTLTLDTTGTGSGSVAFTPGSSCSGDCSQGYDEGTMVTLVASAASDSLFNGWSGCDAVSANACTVTMYASRTVLAGFELKSPDPSYLHMNQARWGQTATTLPDGRVLIAGGMAASELSSAELYNPTTRIFSPTGSLATARRGHTATLLPDGTVLVAGGYNGSGYLQTAEIYNPVTGTFRPAGTLSKPRSWHRAVLLNNGKVLLVGGRSPAYPETTNDLYDPVTGTFTLTGPLSVERMNHTAALLQDGRVLIVGGGSSGAQQSAELYDPATGSCTPAGAPRYPRFNHTATLLDDGRILIVGGLYSNYAELFNPASATFSLTGATAARHEWHAAVKIPSGKVVIIAGLSTPRIETYDPANGTFGYETDMSSTRAWHSATLLADNRIMVAGGYASTSSNYLDTAVLYDLAPLSIVITSPVSGLTNDSTPLLTYTASGGTTVVKVDGVGITKTSGQELDPLADGSHTLRVEVTDATGRITAQEVTFTVDTIPPVIVLSSPVAGLTSDSTPLLLYSVSGGSAVVKVDGVTVAKSPGESLDSLADGTHTVRVEATDAAGNGAAQEVTFTVDTIPPAIVLTSPATGLTNDSTPLLLCSVSGGTAVVKVDGVTVTKSPGESLDSLADGSHTVRVEATDAAGNGAAQEVTFTVDTIPPAIVLNSPAAGTTSDSTPLLLYSVSGGSAVVKVDGVTVTKSPGESLAPLADGSHTLRIEAIDAAGNGADQEVTFIVDTIPPVIVLSSPAAGLTNDSTPLLLYSVNEGSSVQVKVDGVAVTKNLGESLDPLADGTHSVRLEATDAAGNGSFVETTFTIDSVPPTITIKPVATPTRQANVTVSGTRQSGATVSVATNTSALAGKVSYPKPTTWSCAITGLVTGSNTITATARDAAGNTASSQISIVKK